MHYRNEDGYGKISAQSSSGARFISRRKMERGRAGTGPKRLQRGKTLVLQGGTPRATLFPSNSDQRASGLSI